MGNPPILAPAAVEEHTATSEPGGAFEQVYDGDNEHQALEVAHARATCAKRRPGYQLSDRLRPSAKRLIPATSATRARIKNFAPFLRNRSKAVSKPVLAATATAPPATS